MILAFLLRVKRGQAELAFFDSFGCFILDYLGVHNEVGREVQVRENSIFQEPDIAPVAGHS